MDSDSKSLARTRSNTLFSSFTCRIGMDPATDGMRVGLLPTPIPGAGSAETLPAKRQFAACGKLTLTSWVAREWGKMLVTMHWKK